MVSEPDSTLTFLDLQIEVARKIGIGYYGVGGDEVLQAPVDAHDLSEVKRHVNNAIRMFLADSPPSGWRFARPIATIPIWGTVNTSVTNTISGGSFGSGITTVTTIDDSFFETMEGKTITITGVGDFVIRTYTDAKNVVVTGDASTASADTWSLTTDGNFTLPRTFGGQYTGDITYAADTNQGVTVTWTDESTIRRWRENVTDETGDPYWAAVRPMADLFEGRRRWELMLYSQPTGNDLLQFPYDLHFDKLVDNSEFPPIPYTHDETIKAACLAIVDKDVEGLMDGVDWTYYRNTALANSYKLDGRSAPRKLGYMSNPRQGGSNLSPIKVFRDSLYNKPTVTYDS